MKKLLVLRSAGLEGATERPTAQTLHCRTCMPMARDQTCVAIHQIQPETSVRTARVNAVTLVEVLFLVLVAVTVPTASYHYHTFGARLAADSIAVAIYLAVLAAAEWAISANRAHRAASTRRQITSQDEENSR
jgi:uncharacterized membrane protein (DUF485 family)